MADEEWDCQYCPKTFSTKAQALKHEKKCRTNAVRIELQKQLKDCTLLGPVVLIVIGVLTAVFGIGILVFIIGMIWGVARESRAKRLKLELLKLK